MASEKIKVTPLMALIMDALCAASGPLNLGDLAIIITDSQNGVPVTSSQLGPPMQRLRQLKWAQRRKQTIGTKQVGHAEYPIIVRQYNVTPLGRRVWSDLGHTVNRRSTTKLDALALTGANVEVVEKDGRPFAVATINPLHPALREYDHEGGQRPKHDETSFVPTKDKLFGKHTIQTDGSPYMTRIWFGRLRLHIFYRGDADDPHDHPWDFKTFPLTSYVEEIFFGQGESSKRVVPAWRWSYRRAEFRHRVLGRYSGRMTMPTLGGVINDTMRVPGWQARGMESKYVVPLVGPGKIVTIVWRGRERREWGFWLRRAGRFCFQPWPSVRDKGFKEHCD